MCDNITVPYPEWGKCWTWTWYCISAWYKLPLCIWKQFRIFPCWPASWPSRCQLPLCAGQRAVVRTVERSIWTHEVVMRSDIMSYYRYIPSIYKSYWPGLNRTLRSSSVPRHVPDIDYCGWHTMIFFYNPVKIFSKVHSINLRPSDFSNTICSVSVSRQSDLNTSFIKTTTFILIM